MTDITFKSWVELAEKIVSQNPDFVYKSPIGPDGPCLYVHDRETEAEAPGCLIGHMLHDLGIPIPEYCEGSPASSVLSELAVCLIDHGELDKIEEFSNLLQVQQDYGNQWGQALQYAKGKMI